jgi:hypothetical protein
MFFLLPPVIEDKNWREFPGSIITLFLNDAIIIKNIFNLKN